MIRILIADDHPIVREGLKRIINSCPDMHLIGELRNGYEVFTECGQNKVDVLLLDITMPGMGFQNLIRQLRKDLPALKILVLSVHSEEHYALRSLKAGASGYLTKDRSPEELETAIRHVFKGKTYVSASLGEKLAQQLTKNSKKGAYDELSERECQILHLLGAGKRISDIAKLLELSPKTVSTYRSRIFEKMQFNSNADLIRYAVEFDLVE